MFVAHAVRFIHGYVTLYLENLEVFSLSFDSAVASTFASCEHGDAFMLGFAVTVSFVLMTSILPSIVELVIDLIRVKLGLPVARYVRWVKQQDKIDKTKDGEN